MFKGWNETLLLAGVALFVTLTGNLAFFKGAGEIYPWAEHGGFLVSLVVLHVVLLSVVMALLGLVMNPRVVAMFLLIPASVVGYFADEMGVVIDQEMIRSLLQTQPAEAADLLSMGLLMRVLLLGVLPAMVVWRIPLPRRGWPTRLRRTGVTVGVALLTLVVIFALYSPQYYSAIREHKPLRYRSNPLFPIYSVGKFVARWFKSPPSEFKVMAQTARIDSTDSERELVILVVGETVRADHFSLNGYPRETNPRLARETQLVSFAEISSCGTSTAVSVPCMFSFGGKQGFDADTAPYIENVLDVLAKAGVHVLWLDNNSSSKGVADRIEYYDYRTEEINPVCDGECRDEGMLSPIRAYIDGHGGDVLIVLHQMGNHGPAYFKRYPPAFEKFTPACHSEELSHCTREEIINAYDNALLYTDDFLARVIDILKRYTPRYETMMIYVGDHGESLGEGGLYLHGLPPVIAPEGQTHVPLLIWRGYNSRISQDRLEANQKIPNSHDGLSRFLLEVFEVESELISKLTSTSY